MEIMPEPVRLDGGPTLECVEHGDPDGLPVVLLHGLTDAWFSFEPLLPHLPPWIRAIVPTQRGHGPASRSAARFGAGDFAGDVVDLMDALGVPRAVVVGHSMGATVAMRVAIDAPQRVLGLVLMGAFATFGDNAAARELWETVVRDLVDPVPRELAHGFQESTLARPIDPAFLDRASEQSMRVPARTWRGALAGLMADDVFPAIGRIDAPTLLVWGDRDAFSLRADQERLLAGIDGSELAIHEGAGHAMHWEDPARVAGDLRAFLERLPSQEARPSPLRAEGARA